MTSQLNLLGDTAQPEDDELGPVQRAAMRVIRRTVTMSWDEAGAIVHAHRGKHSVDERCEFCGTDGAQLLESLIRRELVVPNGHGYVRLPKHTDGPRIPLGVYEPGSAEAPVITAEGGGQ